MRGSTLTSPIFDIFAPVCYTFYYKVRGVYHKVKGAFYHTVKGDSSLSNIDDNGYTVYYDSSNSENSWLNGETKTLKDCGKLTLHLWNIGGEISIISLFF